MVAAKLWKKVPPAERQYWKGMVLQKTGRFRDVLGRWAVLQTVPDDLTLEQLASRLGTGRIPKRPLGLETPAKGLSQRLLACIGKSFSERASTLVAASAKKAG